MKIMHILSKVSQTIIIILMKISPFENEYFDSEETFS